MTTPPAILKHNAHVLHMKRLSTCSTMMTRHMGPSFSRRTLSRLGPHPPKWKSVRLARSDGWIYFCQSSRRRLNDVGNHPLLVEGLQRHGSALPKLWARSFFTVLRPGTGESHTCRLGTGTRLCGHACAPRPQYRRRPRTRVLSIMYSCQGVVLITTRGICIRETTPPL